MASLWAPNYLSRAPIERAVQRLASHLPAGARVLDVGSGSAPYARYFRHLRYESLDRDPAFAATIQADAAAIPRPDNTYDALLITQTLQHTIDPAAVVAEAHRLLKPGASLLVTVPFAVKMVAPGTVTPPGITASPTRLLPAWRADYWRFTRYGVTYLLRRFRLLSVQETTGYGGTLAQLINYWFAGLKIGGLGAPVYLFFNLLGLGADKVASGVQAALPHSLATPWATLYFSLTSNYIVMGHKSHAHLRREA